MFIQWFWKKPGIGSDSFNKTCYLIAWIVYLYAWRATGAGKKNFRTSGKNEVENVYESCKTQLRKSASWLNFGTMDMWYLDA